MRLGTHRRNEGMAVCARTRTSPGPEAVARHSLAWMRICLLLVSASAFAAQQPLPAAQPAPAEHHAPRTYDFDIGQVALADAIRLFSVRTGLQTLYLPENESEERQLVGPLNGTFTAAEALMRLLEPAGLKFGWVNERTISVERAPPAPPPPPPKPKKRSMAGPRAQRHEPPASPYVHSGLIETVTVSGMTVRRSIDDGTGRMHVIERSDIARMGASTLADVFRNIPQQTYTPPEGFRQSGAQFAELRGLGADTTLILVNGRRVPPSAANITTNAFDLNTIPVPAVERIEVLPDSAAAAYGTDAIGGIVNVILRQEIPEPGAELHYGTAADGAEQRRASVSGGYRREGFSAALVADYFELGGLLGADRDRWRDQDFRRFGGADQRLLISSPGNIRSVTGGNLPGLPSPIAAVPRGSVNNTREDFLPTAGQSNRESLLRYQSLVPPARRVSVVGHLDLRLDENVAAAGEVLYVDRSGDFQLFPPLVNAVVPATNAYNPFEEPVFVQSLLTAIQPQNQNIEAKLLRAVAALRSGFGSWRGELSFADTQEGTAFWGDNAIDPARLAAALAQQDRSLALDVFNDVPGGSPELLAGLLAPRRVETLGSRARQVAAILGGPISRLPAGEATVVLGGEWRREVAEFDATLGSFDRTITAAFAELRIPLIGAHMNVPAVEELTLTAAGRWDDYGDPGDVLNPQYGLTWRPYRDLVVHVAHARAFRPPSLYELYPPKLPIPFPFVDPKRGNEVATIVLVTGGNRDLTPIEGNVLSAGLTFTPGAIAGLKLTASYWRVAMENRITLPTPPLLLADEAAFPDRVVRGVTTPDDIALGRPGPLLMLDSSRVNFGRLETSGIDLSVAYDVDTELGRFTPGLSATWIDEYETVDLPGTAVQDRVNVASELGTIVRWRVVADLGWGRGPLNASVAARYMPSYDDAQVGVRTGRVIPAQTMLDVQASFDLSSLTEGDLLWRGMRLTLGATNVTDEVPPFAEVNMAVGFDFSQGDLKGRFGYVRLDKTF